MVRDGYLWNLNDQSVSDLQYFKKKQKDDDPAELSYIVMKRAEEGEGVIDNTRTSTSVGISDKPRYPKISIGIE